MYINSLYMTDTHPYKYMIDNGVIADPLMKEWIHFENNLFNRLLTPHYYSPLNINHEEASIQKNKMKNIQNKFYLIRKIMYEILDELNDPFFFPNE